MNFSSKSEGKTSEEHVQHFVILYGEQGVFRVQEGVG